MTRVAPFAVALLAGAAGTLAAQQPAAPRIAYVNTNAIMEVAPGRADAEATFQRETEAFRAELQKMNDSLQVLVTAYQRAEPTLTPAQRETRARPIRAFQEQLQTRQGELQQRAAARQEELMAPIMERVKTVLDAIREEGGFVMILAAEPSLILSADKNMDITDRVVARLRTMQAAAPRPATSPAATPPRTGAPVSAPAGVTRPPAQRPPTE